MNAYSPLPNPVFTYNSNSNSPEEFIEDCSTALANTSDLIPEISELVASIDSSWFTETNPSWTASINADSDPRIESPIERT